MGNKFLKEFCNLTLAVRHLGYRNIFTPYLPETRFTVIICANTFIFHYYNLVLYVFQLLIFRLEMHFANFILLNLFFFCSIYTNKFLKIVKNTILDYPCYRWFFFYPVVVSFRATVLYKLLYGLECTNWKKKKKERKKKERCFCQQYGFSSYT